MSRKVSSTQNFKWNTIITKGSAMIKHYSVKYVICVSTHIIEFSLNAFH